MNLIFFFVRIRGRDVMLKRIEVAENARFFFFTVEINLVLFV